MALRPIISRFVPLLFATAWPAFADAQPLPAPDSDRAQFMQRINGVLDQLKLSPDEQTKIEDILHDAKENAIKLRSELADLSPQDRQGKLRDFAASLRKKVDEVLTPEQAREFDLKMAPAQKDGTPALVGPGGNATAGGGRVEQFRSAIAKLDLAPEQKARIHTMFEDLKPKIAEMRTAEPTERRQKGIALLTEMRTKLNDILTPQQQQALRDSMQLATNGGRIDPSTKPAAAEPPRTMMMDDNNMMATAPAKTASAAPVVKTAPSGYVVGENVADLKLDRLDQSPAHLSIYKGRVVALVFGSYSCPTFRDHAEDLNQLSRELGADAAVVLVYTRESNPDGERPLDRNKQAKIFVKQTHTAEDRRTAAQAAKDTLHLVVPIVVDDPDNTLANAFGVVPNGCVVLNRAGVVSARFRWFEPVSAKHAIDKALASPVVMSAPASPADLR